MPALLLAVAQFPHPTLDPNETLPANSGERLDLAGRLAREAAGRGCGALLLPELFADPTQGTKMAGFAEELGGPIASWMSRTARQLNMAIAGTVAIRRSGGAMTNTALAYDARGRLAGHYDKVHLPDGERDVAAPGDAFPVFEFAGLKAGFQICHDMAFPEGCRILALQGAEIIFWPNMWGGMPEANTEAVMRCRAVDNGVVLASSAFVITGGSFRDPKIHGRSCVVDQRGSILAEVGLCVGIAVAAVVVMIVNNVLA
ncbi:MAG TPA: carbon-nitrogen hydrolase family protein, partial [Candidatus Brocadiia bacterium]|nr:carbon-nitrogen hydrolase family protein [Candidatus Brocadiia bacterium]